VLSTSHPSTERFIAFHERIFCARYRHGEARYAAGTVIWPVSSIVSDIIAERHIARSHCYRACVRQLNAKRLCRVRCICLASRLNARSSPSSRFTSWLTLEIVGTACVIFRWCRCSLRRQPSTERSSLHEPYLLPPATVTVKPRYARWKLYLASQIVK